MLKFKQSSSKLPVKSRRSSPYATIGIMFKRKLTPDFAATHQYVEDLKAITILRDRAEDRNRPMEVERYNTNIEVMQLVLETLTKI